MKVNCESFPCSNVLVPGQPEKQKQIKRDYITHIKLIQSKCVPLCERASSPFGGRLIMGAGLLAVLFTSLVGGLFCCGVLLAVRLLSPQGLLRVDTGACGVSLEKVALNMHVKYTT